MTGHFSRRTEIRVSKTPWLIDGLDLLYVYRETIDNVTKISVGLPLTLERYDPYIATAPLPTFHINLETAQGLIDELWNCGLRPTAGAGSAGQMEATERHLKDMQRIVFQHFKDGVNVK